MDWNTPASSTFTRVQQLNVPSFDSNFGNNWDNIKQPGTTRELDAIPMVIMNVPQYRNFNTYQTLVCCHTVDVDATDHAGIRWYELRKTSGTWTLRQSGTYAPDGHSRWMGSIAMNGNGEIGLGYSISSSTEQNPSVTYNALGTYSVTLEVSDGAATDIETKTDYITVAEQQLVYCSSQGNNSSYEWISSVSFGAFTNSSGAAGYTDFTHLPVPMTAGSQVDVHLVPGFSGSTYVEYWRIWIDYNKDGDFDDAGELVFAPPSTSLSIMGNFTVQADATGYILYFGTDDPPTNIENGINLGNATVYDPMGDLSYSSTYYWKIVPYNANGSAQGCHVWSFSTLANPSGPVELSFTDFESGWGIWTDGGSDCSLYTGGSYASGGANAADIQDNSGIASSFYMTKGVDVATPGYVQIDVEFEFIAVSMDRKEDFFMEYFNGSNWYIVASYMQPNHFSNNVFYAAGVSILESNYTFPTDMKVRFHCDAGNDLDDVYIDNIRITASASVDPNNYLVPLNLPVLATAGEGEDHSIRVYPNPVTDELNIEVADNVKAEIYINDMQGRVVHHSIFTDEQQVIHMGSYRTGLYTVLVITPEEFLRTKVVKR